LLEKSLIRSTPFNLAGKGRTVIGS
jgi:hypothetical protein